MRIKNRLLAGAALVALSTSGAFAADLLPQTPPPSAVAIPAEAPASSIRGLIEVGGLYNNVNQTSVTSPFNGSAGGAYVDASIWGGPNDTFMWGIDGVGEYNSFASTGTQAPKYLGVVGAHLGYNTGAGSFGAFGSVGATPNATDSAQGGYTVGVEGIVNLDPARIFGQVGYANVRTAGDTAGFTGWFAHGGVAFALTNDFAVMADAGYGYAPDNFTAAGAGRDGAFTTAGLKVAYKLPTDFDAFITAGYQFAYINDRVTTASATSHTVKVGLSIPFGSGTTAVDALNPLGTYTAPYNAASYATTLQ
jgi:hypothetical protein